MKCDKPFVRDLLLGLYAEAFNFKGKEGSDQSRRALQIYESIAQQKDRVFPMKQQGSDPCTWLGFGDCLWLRRRVGDHR